MFRSWQDAGVSSLVLLRSHLFLSSCPLPPSLSLLLSFPSLLLVAALTTTTPSPPSFCWLVLLSWCSLTSFGLRFLFCLWYCFLCSWDYCSLYGNWLILLVHLRSLWLNHAWDGDPIITLKITDKCQENLNLLADLQKRCSLKPKRLLVTLIGVQVLVRLSLGLGPKLTVGAIVCPACVDLKPVLPGVLPTQTNKWTPQ